MYYYYDLQKNHVVWAKIDAAIAVIEEGIVLNDATQQLFQRYQRIVTELKSRLKAIPVEMISITMLDQIVILIDKLTPKLKQYIQKRDESIFENTEITAEQVLQILYKLYVYRAGSSTSVIKETYESYLSKVSKKENEIKKQLEENTGALTQLRKEIERLDKVVGGYKEKVTNVINDSKRRASEELTSIRSSHKTTIADLKRSFDDLKAQMQREKSSVFHTYDSDFVDMRAANQEQFNNSIVQYNKTYDELLNQLQEKDSKANDILNIIGNKAMTSDYKDEARKQDTMSLILKIASILFMSAIVAGALWVYIDVTVNETTWQLNLVRLLATLSVLYPATYLARESTRHRTLANLLKKKQLELATIDTFIANLPEETRNDIKKSLIDKYFGHYSDENTEKKEAEESISPSMLETVSKVIGACQKFVK